MEIAYKYAQAFLNVYGDQITKEEIWRMNKAAQFLRKHRRALFLLKVPIIDRAIKEEGLYGLCERFALGSASNKLINMLLDYRRSFMLAAVLEAVVYYYKKRNNIVTITIASSCVLTDEQCVEIERFVDRHVPAQKQYCYIIEPSLIAGLRIQSDTTLLEFSVNKQLRDLYHYSMW